MTQPPPQQYIPQEIPANIDHAAIVADLNRWGLADYKIELICGFSMGYVAQLRWGGIREMGYTKAARLHNFWVSELRLRTPVSGYSQSLARSSS